MECNDKQFRCRSDRSNLSFACLYMGNAMRKHVFGHVRITNAQISLRIRAVWSGPSLSANRIIGYYRMLQWRANVWMILCACAGWSESAHHFTDIWRHFFVSLAAHMNRPFSCVTEFVKIEIMINSRMKDRLYIYSSIKNYNCFLLMWPIFKLNRYCALE